jgi:hypothetical protein
MAANTQREYELIAESLACMSRTFGTKRIAWKVVSIASITTNAVRK